MIEAARAMSATLPPPPGPERLVTRALRSMSFRLRCWASWLESVEQHRELKRAGAVRANGIPTWTTRRELQTLFSLARSCPQGAAALEIGSYLGASSCYIAAGLAEIGGHLLCVDTWGNDTIPEGPRDTFADFERNVSGIRDRITPVRARSSDLRDTDIPAPMSLVFLDGDHSYKAVSAEVQRLAPLIRENGIMAFHDAIAFEGVSRTVGEALASGEWQLGGHVDNLVWLRKVRWVEPEYHPPV